MLLENSENEETFLIYLFEWEPGLKEQNSNFLPKWDTLMYKDKVDIPPLGMVDDLICVSECGHKRTMMNSYMKFKTESKKIKFGIKNCKKLH